MIVQSWFLGPPIFIYCLTHFFQSSSLRTKLWSYRWPSIFIMWSKSNGWPCSFDWMTQFWSFLVEFHKIKLKRFQLIQALLLIGMNTKTWGKIMLSPLLPSHRNEQTKIISSSSVQPWLVRWALILSESVMVQVMELELVKALLVRGDMSSWYPELVGPESVKPWYKPWKVKQW